MSQSNDFDSMASNTSQPTATVPFAEMMRRKNLKKNISVTDAEKSKDKDDNVDLDDEIKRLEAELDDSDSDTESSSSDSSGSEDGDDESHMNGQRRRKRVKFGEATVLNTDQDEKVSNQNDNKEGVLCMSECASESILPLPKSALPTSKTRVMKIDREMMQSEGDGRKKKRKRSKGNESGDSNNENGNTNEGLRDAVKEVLSGYVARSSEKIPYYCRVCSIQCSNEEEFITHKKTEFHKVAVQVERKATYCRLCRKQLTSIVQMKEHLKSRPHKEKLDHVQARQRGGGGFRPGRSGYNRGRGRGGGRGRGRGPGRGRGDRSLRSEMNSTCIPTTVQSRRQWS